MSYGVRYEYNTPPREMNRKIERTFNDPSLQVAPGLQTFIAGRTRIFDPDRNNFGPRVGIAFSPDCKTAAAVGSRAIPQRHSAIMRATLPSISPIE